MKCTAVKVKAVQTKARATIALNVRHQKVRGKSMIVGRIKERKSRDGNLIFTFSGHGVKLPIHSEMRLLHPVFVLNLNPCERTCGKQLHL